MFAANANREFLDSAFGGWSSHTAVKWRLPILEGKDDLCSFLFALLIFYISGYLSVANALNLTVKSGEEVSLNVVKEPTPSLSKSNATFSWFRSVRAKRSGGGRTDVTPSSSLPPAPVLCSTGRRPAIQSLIFRLNMQVKHHFSQQ